jgi:hypothetical protein
VTRKTPEQRREDEIRHRMLNCRHFNGVQHDTCEAGVNYRDIKVGTGWGLPCIPHDIKADGTCAKFCTRTREEAIAEIDEWDAAIVRVATCRRAIVEKHGKNRGIQAEMACPTGCGGTLRYSIAQVNGHIHAGCTTATCARWME